MRWGGLSDYELIARRQSKREHLENWHMAFALVPHKTVSGEWIWLEYGERRLTWHPGIGWEGDGAGYRAEWRTL